jgi:hypothetical protein
MNRKVILTQWIVFGLAIILAIAAVTLLGSSKGETQSQVVASEPNFGPNNFRLMRVDTFTDLVFKAYGNFANINVGSKQVTVEITKANQLTRDFFNGNDSLLRFALDDYGFEIKFNEASQSIHAVFAIVKENNCVPVPSDVIIRLAEKAYNK